MKQKNIFIDIGNTGIKWAFRENGKWSETGFLLAKTAEKALKDIRSRMGSEEFGVYVCSVNEPVFNHLKAGFADHELHKMTIASVDESRLNYNTPETLGADRFYAAYGAFESVKRAVILIDAGTACTLDMMDSKGVFHGGVIFPGIKILSGIFKTHALALPEPEHEFPGSWPGKSTVESVKWGTLGMLLDAIISRIKDSEKLVGDACVVLTGGNAALLKAGLDSRGISNVLVQPMCLFEGMRLAAGAG